MHPLPYLSVAPMLHLRSVGRLQLAEFVAGVDGQTVFASHCHCRGTPAGEGDLRLARGASAADGSAEYGRLEIFHAGGWGTACDNAFIGRLDGYPRFSPGSADVACRQMGYQEGNQMQALV